MGWPIDSKPPGSGEHHSVVRWGCCLPISTSLRPRSVLVRMSCCRNSSLLDFFLRSASVTFHLLAVPRMLAGEAFVECAPAITPFETQPRLRRGATTNSGFVSSLLSTIHNKSSERTSQTTRPSIASRLSASSQGSPCDESDCRTCSICTNGFRKTARPTSNRRFGEGIYTSSSSAKANNPYAGGSELVRARQKVSAVLQTFGGCSLHVVLFWTVWLFFSCLAP